jgi:UDP-GlcNAc3NAcA epimerase
MRVLTVIGARPQIIKAAALSREIRLNFADKIEEIILHTGQHYDANMSQVFFDELGIPAPEYNLNIGSASHGKQTALMLRGIENILIEKKPDYLVLYGDTNSTLAGALAGAKLRIPVVHIEAGLRSYNKSMPEEINRIVCDHASTLLFSPTLSGINNLGKEGFNLTASPPFTIDNPGIFHCGDIMFDNLIHFTAIAREKSEIRRKYNLESQEFLLCTIHRDNNTDDPERLSAIFGALNKIANTGISIVIPLHPRTAKMLSGQLPSGLYADIRHNPLFHILPPVSYLEMIFLENQCSMVVSDSGGVQKEAYFFGKPLLIVRPETEWVEIVENGCGIITDANEDRMIDAFDYFRKAELSFPPVFGDGHAAEYICKTLLMNRQQ